MADTLDGSYEKHLRAMSEASYDPITMIRGDDTIIFWSPAAERMFGFSAAEAMGQKLHDLIVPQSHRQKALTGLKHFSNTGTGSVIGTVSEFEALCKDGSKLPVERSVSACQVDGEWHAVGVLRDISERKKAEERLRTAYEQVRQQQEIINLDLQTAAQIQQTLLPGSLPPSRHYDLAWQYRPSALIGGDVFAVIPLGGGKTAFYMIDISGHGVSAALVSFSVAQFLRQLLTSSPTMAPAAVIMALDKEYPLERFDKFFTMIFMVHDPFAQTITYCNAGHPPALLIRDQETMIPLDTGGLPVGLGGMIPYREGLVAIQPTDLCFIYTDGATEVENRAGEQLGISGLTETVQSQWGRKVDEVITRVEAAIDNHCNPVPTDDITLACLKFK